MATKAFRVDWYPRESFMDFAMLHAEEIGVLMQIINLIYSKNGPINNDPKHIGKSCGLTQKKCERIIHRLIQKGHLKEIHPDKLYNKRCDIELKDWKERVEKYSKNGQKGAEKRWQTQENQIVSDGQAIFDSMASTSTNNQYIINTGTGTADRSAWQEGGDLSRFGQKAVTEPSPSKLFNIEDYLDDEDRRRAREAAPLWDQQLLIRTYNNWINGGNRPIPDKPALAYIGWCKKYTKGKPP